MAFTGLYKEYYFYSFFIFVFRFRSGAYDYWNGAEDMCGWRKESDLTSIHLKSSTAKARALELNRQIKTT